MTKSRMKSEVFTADIEAMQEISKKHSIKNIIFYKWEKVEYIDLLSKLDQLGIFLYNYSNKSDLINQVSELNKNFEIIFVNTTLELLINIANDVKKSIWQKITTNPKIYRNKFLQRELIQKHNPNLGVKFIKWTIETLKIEDIEKNVPYPFIIKPVDWVQSSWVAKIKNRNDFDNYISHYNEFHDRLELRWIHTKELLIEEFIDGTLYSVDYFVNQEWKIILTKPVKQRLLTDIDFEDYWVLARISSKKTESEFKWKKLSVFVSSTVEATWIKNTYVHHEFKINSKWELKTIEINWRIWGWRLELLKNAYWLNIYELVCNNELKLPKLKENNIVANIYSTKKWILTSFNHNLIEKMKEKPSIYEIETDETAIWKEIWLTKDWFIKIWAIKMANKNYDELAEDFKFVKKHYWDLLIVDEFEESKKIKKKNIFKIFRNYLNI